MRRKTLIHLLLLGLLLGCTGCTLLQESPYAHMDNWMVRQNATLRHFATYDMFFIPPTQLQPGEDSPMNWHKYGLAERCYNYTIHHTTRIFGNRVRVFAPFVHQLDPVTYRKFLLSPPLEVMSSPLGYAVEDAVRALEYYFAHYHKPGRPYILYGQGQGAHILYEAMKQCSKITPKSGFVAAYFPGLVGISAEQMRRDLGGRGIRPATGEYDVAVITAWNVYDWDGNDAIEDAGSYIINPLNWETDMSEASAETNAKSAAYDPLASPDIKQQTEYEQLCGAVIDVEDGTLRLLPAPNRDDELERVIRQGTTYGLFAGSIVENALKRVRQYTYRAQWNHELPPDIPVLPEPKGPGIPVSPEQAADWQP